MMMRVWGVCVMGVMWRDIQCARVWVVRACIVHWMDMDTHDETLDRM